MPDLVLSDSGTEEVTSESQVQDFWGWESGQKPLSFPRAPEHSETQTPNRMDLSEFIKADLVSLPRGNGSPEKRSDVPKATQLVLQGLWHVWQRRETWPGSQLCDRPPLRTSPSTPGEG